jgi:hypothetical protein
MKNDRALLGAGNIPMPSAEFARKSSSKILYGFKTAGRFFGFDFCAVRVRNLCSCPYSIESEPQDRAGRTIKNRKERIRPRNGYPRGRIYLGGAHCRSNITRQTDRFAVHRPEGCGVDISACVRHGHG